MAETTAAETSPQRLIDQFWETIPPTWKRVRSQLHGTAFERFGVTEEQWHILRHIRKGFNSVSQLAQAKQITRSAISQSVELLVEKGLVERRTNTADRRFIELTLTPQGEELVATIFQINRVWMLEKLSSLSPQQIQAAVDGMRVLQQAFLPPDHE